MEHVAHMIEMRAVYKILDRKTEGKILIGRQLPKKDSAPWSYSAKHTGTISIQRCIYTLGAPLRLHSGDEFFPDHVCVKSA
jgi:hypothetical protein